MVNLTKLLLLSLLPSILTSCSLFGIGEIPAVIDTTDKRICVIPFAIDKLGQKEAYFKSKTGLRIADDIADLIQSGGENVTIMDHEALEADISSYRFTKPNWGQLCQKHELDFILVGTITKFSLTGSKNTTFMKGVAGIKLKVIDQSNDVLFSELFDPIVFPKPRSQDPSFTLPGAHAFDISPDQIQKGLEQEIAILIAELFYDHSPDDF